MWAVADLRGTKPAPNGTDIPGQCTRELGLLGESATSLMSAQLCQDEYCSGPLELNQALRSGVSVLQTSLRAPLGCLLALSLGAC